MPTCGHACWSSLYSSCDDEPDARELIAAVLTGNGAEWFRSSQQL